MDTDTKDVVIRRQTIDDDVPSPLAVVFSTRLGCIPGAGWVACVYFTFYSGYVPTGLYLAQPVSVLMPHRLTVDVVTISETQICIAINNITS